MIDTISVEVLASTGVALRLNHTAEIESVELAGQSVDYSFGGGLLWVDVQDDAELVIRYQIDVARDSTFGVNSGRFGRHAGHVRNQYFWHPFIWFSDSADFRLSVRAPREVYIATDLPQTERVLGEQRVVLAQSDEATAALSLFYDDEWEPVRRRIGSYAFAVYATPEFSPHPDTLAAVFDRVSTLLSERFGTPRGRSLAVVQQRAREGTGWPFMSNRVIAANANGGSPSVASPIPRAFFGHEVAHGWTRPTGPARNFLGEGWATFAEALVLGDTYGADVEIAFWESQRNRYFIRGFDGVKSLATDASNSGVSYHKGAWVFRVLEAEIGRDAFDQGLRTYASNPRGNGSGYEGFLTAMSEAAGRDLSSFLLPWYEGSVVPELRSRIEGRTLVVEQVQSGPVFDLNVEVDLVSDAGTVRVVASLKGRMTTVPFPDDVGLSPRPILDPESRLLFRRTLGDRVRFTHDAGAGADVKLQGDFSSSALASQYDGEAWFVELPIAAGRYVYRWVVDGERQPYQVLRVAPFRELSEAYPR
ncbi:MAG: M1 family aminopeptidase [Bacteroidota bacterium]